MGESWEEIVERRYQEQRAQRNKMQRRATICLHVGDAIRLVLVVAAWVWGGWQLGVAALLVCLSWMYFAYDGHFTRWYI